jgi:hypothetical protein
MFNHNAPAFSPHNKSVKLVPITGSRAGKPFTCRSTEKTTFVTGRKAVQMHGIDEGPLTVIAGKAEPKFDMDLSIATEAQEAVEHVGVGNRFNVIVVYSKAGLASVTWEFSACLFGEGGGFDDDGDAKVSGKLECVPSDVKRNGVSIYERAA